MRDSKARFETILRLYYLRHSFITHAPIMVQFLLVLGFSLAGEVPEAPPPPERLEESKSSLMLATQGLYHQAQGAHLSNTVFRLLYNALPTDAANIADRYFSLKKTDTSSQVLSQYIRAAYPVNVVSMNDDAEEQRLSRLLQKLQT